MLKTAPADYLDVCHYPKDPSDVLLWVWLDGRLLTEELPSPHATHPDAFGYSIDFGLCGRVSHAEGVISLSWSGEPEQARTARLVADRLLAKYPGYDLWCFGGYNEPASIPEDL